MMDAFLRFNKGVLKFPVGVKLWLLVLLVANFLIPLLLLPRLEATVVLATFFASFGLMVLITRLSGFTRLLGLGHILLIPLIFYLWGPLGGAEDSGLYSIWLRGLIAVNTVCVLLDAIDIARYLRGDRGEMVAGL